jgi:hypothetical protein
MVREIFGRTLFLLFTFLTVATSYILNIYTAMNNSLHGSSTSNEGNDDVFINDTPDGMDNYVDDTLFPMLDEGSLDHAILESLFYNEMALLNNSGINENNTKGDIPTFSIGDNDSFLVPQANSTTDNVENGGNSHLPVPSNYSGIPLHLDSQTTNLGNDSIVIPSHSLQNENSMFTHANQHNTTDPLQNLCAAPSYPDIRTSVPNPLGGAIDSQNAVHHLYPYPHGVTPSIGEITLSHQYAQQDQISASTLPRKLTVQLPMHTIVTGSGIRHNVIPVTDNNDATQKEQQAPITQNDIDIPTKPTSPSAEEKKRKKLIAQFATLAGRLGITLPPQVLQKLTDKAADATNAGTSMTPNPILSDTVTVVPSSTTVTQTVSDNPMETECTNNNEAESPAQPQPVLLQQVQKSAAEAIAAVDNKRSITAVGASTNIDSTYGATDGNKPYSKKRKKPRLSDCEQKLAELKSENSILKRHLDNIANQNARLDEERMKAEKQMRQMLQDNSPDSILDPIVKNFTEMYSDYGRKRHDELNFHLQQLQR